MVERICCICQQPIIGRRSDAITCSPACAKERKAAVQRERWAADPEAQRAKYRAYREADRDRYLENEARWREANRDRAREAGRKYARKFRAENPEAQRAKDRAYRERTRERTRELARAQYAANVDARREEQRQRRLANLEKHRAWGRAKEAKRRAAKKGAARIEHVTLAYVAERDGWRCHLCGLKVNPRMSHPDQASASLDHVIPLALGGEHTKDNIRLAHLGCNASKRTRAMNEQLLLVG